MIGSETCAYLTALDTRFPRERAEDVERREEPCGKRAAPRLSGSTDRNPYANRR
jgi:hypothetical protein